ncbi:MAG: translation initiation factor IF-2 [Defluviitaleaceae bacterium]|nr:translation initiation factor IF-2 [Defluviitaleaceae bacterium]
MAKKRIHELAKELGVGSSDIMKFLPQLNIEAKTHFLGLDADVAQKVANHFGKAVPVATDGEKKVKQQAEKPVVSAPAEKKPAPAQKAEEKPAERPAARAAERPAPRQDRERPVRYDKDGNVVPYRPRPVDEHGNPLPRKRPVGPDGKPLPPPVYYDAQGNPIPRKPRPIGADGKPMPRPPRPLGPDGKPVPPPVRYDAQGNPIPRKPRPLGTDGKPLPRPDRPHGSGDRPQRPYGDRPPRPQGSSDRPHSDRPRGQFGDRPPRPQGDRPQYGNRPQGDRPPRPGGDRPSFGGRPGGGGQGGFRQGGHGSGRAGGSDIPAVGGGGFNKGKQGGGKTAEAPDKQGRKQRLEAGKKDRRHDRGGVDREKDLDFRPQVKSYAKPEAPSIIQIPPQITLKELAELMLKQGSEVVKALFKKGEMIKITDTISFEKAEEIAMDYNILVEEKIEIDILEEVFAEEEEAHAVLAERPPVVVVMGHVDHGKTSLLDAIRKTDVVVGEAGGITQHIGAYQVNINDRQITFLDTPGHEAFTAMRMRGAQVTDIAILVVAADDGVMPQTIEAISHARAAGVEIIVAINKIDKPAANKDRVMQELTEYELVAEDYGGETIMVPVSAHTKEGLDTLLEMIMLVTDMKEYKANPDKNARGTVIEAQLDKGRGPVATVLVKSGTLEVGQPIVAGTAHGRVRAMVNDKGQKVKAAGPSMPVEILGLTSVPSVGDLFFAAKSEKEARYVAEHIIAKNRVKMIEETPQKVSLDDLFNQIQAGKVKELNVIIKADVGGSVEAMKASLEKLSNEEVRIRTILGGVGAVTESDVMLASASNAIIIGFNVRPENAAKSVAEEQQVDIRLYRVIYNAIDDVKAAMIGMLDPIFEEKVIGHANVRQIFKASGIGTIAGCYVTDGKITRSAQVRVLRDNIVVYEGELASLNRFKDQVREVLHNYECGIVLSKFNDVKEGDVIEAFVMEEIRRTE